LPTGNEFFRQLLVLNSWLSFPALAIIIACLGVLLRLTPDQWRWFFGLIAVYGLLATPITAAVQRRMVAPVVAWLDARHEATESLRRSAFAKLMALPTYTSLVVALSWLVPVVLISFAMSVLFEAWDLFGFETAVLLVAGAAAAFSMGTFMGFRFKTRFAPIREALTLELPDPEVRRRLIRPIDTRTRMLATVIGVTLVPVVLAVLLSMSRSEASLEEFAIRWQVRLLDAVPEDASEDDLAELQRRLDGAHLPAPVRLLPLSDLEATMDEEVLAHLRAQIAAGRRKGHSARLPSSIVFAWRTLPDGRTLVAASPADRLRADGGRSTLIFVSLLLVSAGLAFGVAHLLSSEVSNATAMIRSEVERLARGDLRRGRVFESEDELGELARSFETMAQSLQATVSRVAEAADRVEATAGELSPVSASVARVSSDQFVGIEQATARMEVLSTQARDIAASSQSLGDTVEESSSLTLELGASGEELNGTAFLLSSKVEEVSSSIEQMVRSVSQVSANTESLTQAAEETSASMEQMASSLREVDASAAEATRLSTQVVSSAERGRVKVRQTIDGMEAIRDATETAERVIRSLHGRSGEIGAIVDVIDDVADETGLLALNAAIIAAQAGEQGRAFSVVAEEIRELAERVLASTREIGALIGAVQAEATNAIGAIERGSASVASGVQLSAEAGMALEEITRASRDSGAHIGEIVGALREQAKAAGHVVSLMDRVRDGVGQIRSATIEQDRGNAVVFQGSVTMREVAAQVRGTSAEQARGAGRMRESTEGMRLAVEQIQAAIREQSEACVAALELLAAVRSRTRENEESAKVMDAVTKGLLVQAEGLRNEVRRFQI
jgi:methyl-accepting chemotaxis protein